MRRFTSLLTDSEVDAFVLAQQVQIDRDFGNVWNAFGTVSVGPAEAAENPTDWNVLLLDNSDIPGDLGYHDADGSVPVAKVFVSDAINDGLRWSVSASHEVLEMLADPNIDRTVTRGRYTYALEVCDPVEDDSFGYDIAGVTMSAFVKPAWFGIGPNVRDFCWPKIMQINAPFVLAYGGYISRYQWPFGNWEQTMADKVGPRAVNKKPTSRTMRRFNKRNTQG